jgi:penicillin-binding protein 1C
MTTLFRTPDEYGLSLILGGAEGKLWDIAGVYASMARSLNRYNATRTQTKLDFYPPHYIATAPPTIEGKLNDHSWLNPAATWFTFDALTEVNRPEEDANWSKFSTSSRIAWKTGTSFGFRDGWAVGVTPKYVIAVWVGNATGEGRPGLTGIQTAAPILFDIFSMLRSPDWFEKPEQLMKQVRVCTQSGMRALDLCEGQQQWIPEAGLKSGACKYHRTVHLDASMKYRVSSDCASPSEMQHVSWFVLPPAMEFYYRVKNPLYKVLPPYLSGCSHQSSSYMEFVYPREETRLSLPTELDGRPGKIIFEIAHRSPTATVHWHLDEEFVGSTTGIHQLALNPSEGQHRVTCVDDNGETIMTKVEIVPSRNH